MSNLLYIQASPRIERSRSRAVAEAFLDARDGRDNVTTLDLFQADLPELDEATLDAKYAILNGLPADAQAHGRWQRVEEIIEQFKAADAYLLAVPMWNYHIPYRLKHYLDIIIQPSYTFRYDPQTGFQGLVTGKSAVIIYARGGDYSGEMNSWDMQQPYLNNILGKLGFTTIHEIIAAPTVAAGPHAANEAVAKATREARQLAETLGG
jgi:FMN-dependent NADH-azoreductase